MDPARRLDIVKPAGPRMVFCHTPLLCRGLSLDRDGAIVQNASLNRSRRLFRGVFRKFGLAVVGGVALLAAGARAEAALKICNKTAARIGVAIGIDANGGLSSQGWFNVRPGGCETVLDGDLGTGPYFVHAVDYDRGGEWGGPDLLCVSDGEFLIDGAQDCYARGFARAGFRRIETRGQTQWSIDLTDGNRRLSGVSP
jgi:uncharacterized membrane protein